MPGGVMTIKNLELSHKEAIERVQAHTAIIQSVEARLIAIDDELQRFEAALTESVFTNETAIDWQKKATERHALELQKVTMPGVIARLNEALEPLNRESEHLAWRISETEREGAENIIISKIQQMQAAGENPKTIKSECGLNEREYDRYSHLARSL
jgi:hypothetical protein